jgi:Leucine-rich repeat (LRR) protein
LDFGNNQIELELASFNGLTSLKMINLSNNQIKKIHPFTFYDLIKLEYLDFERNKIK